MRKTRGGKSVQFFGGEKLFHMIKKEREKKEYGLRCRGEYFRKKYTYSWSLFNEQVDQGVHFLFKMRYIKNRFLCFLAIEC